jgi:hypothetical protein
LAGQLAAQSPPATVVLEGVTVNAVTGAPISNARSKLEKQPADLYARADSQGHFQFAGLAPGEYTWSVESPGFLPVDHAFVFLAASGASRVGAAGGTAAAATMTEYDAADGTRHVQLTVPLTAYAVIAGRVTDPSGLPLEDCRINVTPAEGNSAPLHFFRMGMGQILTDERGEYRAPGLPPGRYYVAAENPLRGRDESLRSTFFPAAMVRESAKTIELAAGQQARADIRIVRVNGVQVSGRFMAPPDSSAAAGPARTIVRLEPSLPATTQTPPATIANGAFQFNDVLPGKYTLMALTTVPTEGATRDQKSVAGGMREVEVGNQNVDGLDLALQPMHDLAGAVKFAAGCAARPVEFRLLPDPEGPSLQSRSVIATSAADGTFVVTGFGVGRFTVGHLRAIPALRVLSVSLGARDVLLNGIEEPVGGSDLLLITVDCVTPGRLP